jgi:hypothetical protein
MCGGDAKAFESRQAGGMAFARAVTLLGGSGAGQLAKMVNQIAIAGLVQGLSEAIAFGKRAGLDMEQVLDVIGKGAAQSWQMDNRGKTMIADKFEFGFAVDWMRKDLGIVLEEATRNGARLPVTALVDQFYADVQQMGGQRWDTSSLINPAEVNAGAGPAAKDAKDSRRTRKRIGEGRRAARGSGSSGGSGTATAGAENPTAAFASASFRVLRGAAVRSRASASRSSVRRARLRGRDLAQFFVGDHLEQPHHALHARHAAGDLVARSASRWVTRPIR